MILKQLVNVVSTPGQSSKVIAFHISSAKQITLPSLSIEPRIFFAGTVTLSKSTAYDFSILYIATLVVSKYSTSTRSPSRNNPFGV